MSNLCVNFGQVSGFLLDEVSMVSVRKVGTIWTEISKDESVWVPAPLT